jgi:hypothetical protein
MKFFDDPGGTVLALVFSAAARLGAASGAFMPVTFIGARFVSDELSYGVTLVLAPPAGLAVAGLVSSKSFKKCSLNKRSAV